MVSLSRRQQGWSFLVTLAALFSLITSVLAANSPRRSVAHKDVFHRRQASTDLSRAVNSRARSCKKTVKTSTNPPANTTTPSNTNTTPKTSTPSSCFPSLGHTPGADDYKNTTPDNWWCDSNTESGFFGFTYGLDNCPSLSDMKSDFAKMRSNYKARYVRIYSECANEPSDMWDNILQAAYENGMGVMATMWFGFDPSSDPYQARWNHLTKAVQSNPLAPYVMRTVDVGSEPLTDGVPGDVNVLISYVKKMKALASPKGIAVGISEMQYKFVADPSILNEVDYIHTHELSFLGKTATTGSAAWPHIETDMQWYAAHAPGKSVTITETGWPVGNHDFQSASSQVSVTASSAQGYVSVLNNHCGDMKKIIGQGVGWFWSTWSEDSLTGWGLMNGAGKPTFSFQPQVNCN